MRYVVIVPLPDDAGYQVVCRHAAAEDAQAVCEAIVLAGADGARIHDRDRQVIWRYTWGRHGGAWWEMELCHDATARDDLAYLREWTGCYEG